MYFGSMKGRFCVFALAEFLEGLEASATRYFVSHLTNDYNYVSLFL